MIHFQSKVAERISKLELEQTTQNT